MGKQEAECLRRAEVKLSTAEPACHQGAACAPSLLRTLTTASAVLILQCLVQNYQSQPLDRACRCDRLAPAPLHDASLCAPAAAAGCTWHLTTPTPMLATAIHLNGCAMADIPRRTSRRRCMALQSRLRCLPQTIAFFGKARHLWNRYASTFTSSGQYSRSCPAGSR